MRFGQTRLEVSDTGFFWICVACCRSVSFANEKIPSIPHHVRPHAFPNNGRVRTIHYEYLYKDGILNDNQYEYETVGHPFLYQLGQTIYQHELARKRKHHPDLKRFEVSCEKPENDARPVVRDVDN